MRDYGKVFNSFWTSDDTRSMSEDGRTLALYLLTCPHGNMLGVFRLTNAYAADDLQWTHERVSKGFAELFAKGFAYRCERTFWVFIRHHLKWNPLENPNVGLAAAKLFESLTCPPLVRALLAQALRDFAPKFPLERIAEIETVPEPFPNRSETVTACIPEPVTVTVAVTETIAVAETVTVPRRPRAVAEREGFERFWSAYPKKVGKTVAFKAWEKLNPSPALVDEILTAVEMNKLGEQWLKDGGQFIPHPSTWLNGQRWTDEITPYVARPVVRRESDLDRSRREAYEKLTGKQSNASHDSNVIDV